MMGSDEGVIDGQGHHAHVWLSRHDQTRAKISDSFLATKSFHVHRVRFAHDVAGKGRIGRTTANSECSG